METLKRKAVDSPGDAYQASSLKPPLAAAAVEPRAPTTLAAAEPVACVHDVSYPEGYDPSASTSRAIAGGADASEPAKKFPFQLDPFQAEAIRCLDNGESVMVSAHTSAGKTVVALYAIAMSLRNQQRVIYTSPIKALSNQKYREFKEEFSDVGLMTGDVTIEPNASCLVMTTEIWRSMQYKGSEVMREVAWVIFDEVHYMRDRERGVVWEESIVMAPKNSRFVFLSATVPNAKEFADWVAKVHKQPCHIVYTDYRPTPLQHYVFPSGGDGLYLVVDEKGKFREDSFQKALNALVPASDSAKKKENGKRQKFTMAGTSSEESDIFKMVKMIIQRQYDPVILFSFSKRECEFLAMQMAKMDLNEDDEKANIETIFWSAMDMLSDDDKKLPQVSNMLPLLKRGIGVHHSGLLPILKEVIEILFQEGLIKCLFATETFSIGLNMPAKTVVFTNVRKFDGDRFRWLSSGEYIQMSGRAGRRGIDLRGICILMVDEKMEPSTAKMMLKGSADSLNSFSGFVLADKRPEDSDYTVDVLTRCSVTKDNSGKKTMKVVPLKARGEPVVVSLSLSQIDGLSSIRMYIPKDLIPVEVRENTLRKVEEVLLRFAKDGVPLLDPEEDMKVQSKSFRKATRRIEALESLFEKHDIRNSPHIQQKLKVFHAKQELSAKIKSIKKTMRSSTALAFKDELKARKRVLRRLGYCILF
ncbi:DExH-box ATP-dependent RNA helicase DExH9 [Zea mays]|uniref:DExH-box ATP-dependent RNA helicase DExH9 n=1 Tax=Zea mays TaxID=4577 RepID=A0A1D6NX79_MAIZE|nr:DExH-box ATP-dependent RNA helicase DExH9 [Zea mays]